MCRSPYHMVVFCEEREGVCCEWGAVTSRGIVVQHMTHEVKIQNDKLRNRSMNPVCLHHTHCISKGLKLDSKTEDAHG